MKELPRYTAIFGDRWLNFRWIYRRARQLVVTDVAASGGRIGRLRYVRRKLATYLFDQLYDTFFVHRIKCIDMGDGWIFMRKVKRQMLERGTAREGEGCTSGLVTVIPSFGTQSALIRCSIDRFGNDSGVRPERSLPGKCGPRAS
jgi:hypothetical protein